MLCTSFVLVYPVPELDVDVDLSYSTTLYAGTELTLTCTVTVTPSLDNEDSVVTKWSGPDISGNRFSDTDASGSGRTYSGSLTISPLADWDDGTYTCTATATESNGIHQATGSDDVAIIVRGEIGKNVYLIL